MYGRVLLLSLVVYNVHRSSAVIYTCNETVDCGCSTNYANVHKIVGGEDAFPSSWGWAVSLQAPLGSHFCTGAIVSPLHVITAAHCFTDPAAVESVSVVVGTNQVIDISDTPQVRSISAVFAHPEYNDSTQLNDIAVLRLNEPLNISVAMNTARVCFPRLEPSSKLDNYPGDFAPLVAIGWGYLMHGEQSIPSNRHLQQVTVQAMPLSDDRCTMFITNSTVQFCAGVTGGGKDTCQGDSGGPLMRFEPKLRRWLLAGVTSFGLGCGDPRYAGVYTRVSAYRDWLRSVITDGLTEASGELYTSAAANYFHISVTLLVIMSLFLFYLNI